MKILLTTLLALVLSNVYGDICKDKSDNGCVYVKIVNNQGKLFNVETLGNWTLECDNPDNCYCFIHDDCYGTVTEITANFSTDNYNQEDSHFFHAYTLTKSDDDYDPTPDETIALDIFPDVNSGKATLRLCSRDCPYPQVKCYYDSKKTKIVNLGGDVTNRTLYCDLEGYETP